MDNMNKKKIDWMITILPLVLIIGLCIIFFAFPETSNIILGKIRFFLGDTMGTYYLAIGLGMFILSIYMCVSPYGNIVLGEKDEKPRYSFFVWGSMMFTCGLAADILFYSFSEWVMYATNPHIAELGTIQEWAGVFPIFHWSFIPWAFYLVLAVAFGYMLHVRKCKKQRFSEACRPVLGKHTDGISGRLIDLLAVFALLAGTATTFSVATPLMATIIQNLFNIEISRTAITIFIVVVTCIVYTYSLLHGFKGISILAKVCIYMFFGLILIVLVIGGQGRYIIDTGFESFGRMVQNFIMLSTYTDPERKTNFAQDWTIYYWAYWMVWCVAAPFFMGMISRGRTIKQVIMGSYIFGTASTLVSFIVLGNFGLGMKVHGKFDAVADYYANGEDLYQTIIDIIHQLPLPQLFLVILVIAMFAFYATSFDSITMVASNYSYKNMNGDETASKKMKLFWAGLLIMLPIALIFSEGTMANLQTVSIIAAFPIGIVMIMIVLSFVKDTKKYLEELKEKKIDKT